MIKIEYRYKNQVSCRFFAKCKDLEKVIDWLRRFKYKKLKDNMQDEDIEEIRIIYRRLNYR